VRPSNVQLSGNLAGAMGLEPAASCVTGQRAMVDLLERRALVPD
jgi:hypothetical protein